LGTPRKYPTRFEKERAIANPFKTTFGSKPPMLELFLFGPFKLAGDDGSDYTPKSVKARAILAMLALSPRGSRSRVWLRHKLWSDKSEEQAGASLRQALLDIRRSLGAISERIVHSDKNTVTLNLDMILTDLEQWIARARDADDLSQGEFSIDENFLEGLSVRDPEFQDWLIKEQTVLRRKLDDAGSQIDLRPKTNASSAAEPSTPAEPSKTVHLDEEFHQWKLVMLPSKSIGLDPELTRYQWELAHLSRKTFLDTGSYLVQDFDGPMGYLHGRDQHHSGTLGIQTTLYRDAGVIRAESQLSDANTGNLVWVGNFQASSGQDNMIPNGFGHDLVAIAQCQATRYLQSLENEAVENRIANAVSAMFALSEEDLKKSEEILLQCIIQKPSAQAYAWLAFNMTFRVGQRMKFEDVIVIEQAQEYAQKALELDRGNALVSTLVAHVHSYLFGEYDFAAGLFEKALKINPTQILGWDLYGILHAYAGQPMQALSMANWACKLGGQCSFQYYYETTRAIAANFAGQHSIAIHAGSTALSARPDFNSLLRVLVSSHAHLGQLDKAEHYLNKLKLVEPDFSISALRAAGYPGLDTDGGRDFVKGLLKAGVSRD